MTAVINGVSVSGTPEEIAKLIALTKTTITSTLTYTTGSGVAKGFTKCGICGGWHTAAMGCTNANRVATT